MEPSYPVLALAAAVGLVFVHLFSARLRFLEGIPRSIWLSFAGGISVAYVFVHLLPELAEGQEVMREAIGGARLGLERHVYLVALAGLAVFYGLERMAICSKRANARARTEAEIFWIHIASFSLYNLLIGYLLVHREEESLSALLLFFVAMALHFVVNDYGLREHHKDRYRRVGRWLLSAAVLGGWALGTVLTVDRAVLGALIAFLAGGVVLNVLKEELPEERESRFSAFLVGSATYAALLLALR